MSDLKAKLLAVHTPTGTVPIEGIGNVTVRGLTRGEVLRLGRMEFDDVRDALTISLGMVDPPMTPDEVTEWNDAALTDEIDDVRHKIMVLSKMVKDAAKEVYKELEANPDLEFPVLPGEPAGDDGGPALGADE